jgi:hypothetical protein
MRYSRIAVDDPPIRWNALWKSGATAAPAGPVHVSMNDYLIHRARDIPGVAREGLRFRHQWPATPGALGLWVAALRLGRRQISVSVWRDAEDLKRFVRSPQHLRIMREFRHAGALYTTAWTAERLDRGLIWHQANDRLRGRVAGVPHH